MRTLATILCLALPLALAAPAQAQGLDKDVLEDIIDKATKTPKKAKKAAKVKKKADAKPKTDKAHAKAMRKVLRKKKVDVNFVKTPFAQVLAFLRTQSGLTITVTEKATKALAKTPVTVTLRGKALMLRTVLDLTLEQASKELRCGVKQGAMWVGLEDEWKTAKATKL